MATLVALPAGIVQAPHATPGWKEIGSSCARRAGNGARVPPLLRDDHRRGRGYASLVTYLVPPIALAYGAIFLGERFGVAAFGGLALILGGVALGTGAVGVRALRRIASAM